MKIYSKKSDILDNLGKDKKDTKYLDRAIERWEVLCYGWYYIKKDDLIGEAMNILLWENAELKKEIENISENSEELEEAKVNEELEEARVNVEYYKNEAEEERDKRVALESVLDGLRAKGISIGYANE